MERTRWGNHPPRASSVEPLNSPPLLPCRGASLAASRSMNALANPPSSLPSISSSPASTEPGLDPLRDTDLGWEGQFAALREFRQAQGHLRVPEGSAGERALRAWMEAQRGRARAGDLTRPEHERLSALGFDWEPRDGDWERWMDRIRAFRRTHGHCTVPERERELAGWVERVREQYHLGQLSAERVKLLTELGFSWQLDREVGAARWAGRLGELEEFKRQHGHCRVPNHSKEWPALAVWVGNLRQERRRGKLSQARIEALDALGFDWEPGNAAGEARWEARYVQLVEYQARHGHCSVPAKWAEDHAFGHWVHNQRAFKKCGRLSAERVRRLEALGFAWEGADGRSDPQEVYLEKMLAALEVFRREHGHTEVPKSYEDGRLAKWVVRQRVALRSGEMSAERRARLEAAGFVWRATRRQDAARWEERFAQLLAFRERFGHCRVPMRWAEDTCFAHWMHNLRVFRNRGTLNDERIARLEAIGFEWKGPQFRCPTFDAHWESMFAQLVAFHAQHGHTEVPPGSMAATGLGKWVQRQRHAVKRGELRADRRAQLEALGFSSHGTRRGDADRWERRFAQLVAFRARFGHCRVTKTFREDSAFGHWVDNQRLFKRQGKLSAERMARLEECGIVW